MNTIQYLRNLPIRRKLTILLLVPCVVVLLLAGAAQLWFQLSTFRKDFARDLTAVAQIVANNATAAITFKDMAAATEMLGALKAKEHIVSAALLTPNNQVFARYGAAEATPPASELSSAHVVFRGDHVLVTQPVMLEGEQIATLRMTSDYRTVYRSLMKMVGWMMLLVVGMAAAVATLLSSRLQRFVSAPIQRLAETSRQVADRNDYSVRAEEEDDPEFGLLTRTFNQMLTRIQSQDEALTLSQQKLEALVHSIDGIVWECKPDTFRFTFVSRQSERILGYTPEQWIADANFWRSRIYPEDAQRTIQACSNAVAKREPYSYEYRMLAADGRVVWIQESGVVLVEHDQPVAVRGIFFDVTEHKKAADELDRLNRRLLETSRLAGMAEVATGVLHNVGNVLNSVGVSATLVGGRLKQSKVTNLRRATTLLREQDGNLAHFLTADPKGKVLPEYLYTVSEQLANEQSVMLNEVALLSQNIDHIKEIVAMQQSYAKVSGAFEDLDPATVVEDALRINAAAFERHHIAVVREFAPDLPRVNTDRHKVLQILINLLRNAKYAMNAGRAPDKRLVVSVRQTPDGMVAIRVRDNGVGISPENVSRIFSHGFTTKKDGHGFGLHSGANAAKEIGGRLAAHSDGLGQGAEFTLELPVAKHGKAIHL